MAQNPFDTYGLDYIASLNNSYRDAEIKSSGTTVLPEGKYQAMVNYYSLKESKTYADELVMSLGFIITTGPQKGKTVFKTYPIVPERIGTLKTDLSILNIDINDDIRSLGDPQTAGKILDLIVDLTIKHKHVEERIYQNIYLNRCHGKAEENFVEAPDDDDELPWK